MALLRGSLSRDLVAVFLLILAMASTWQLRPVSYGIPAAGTTSFVAPLLACIVALIGAVLPYALHPALLGRQLPPTQVAILRWACALPLALCVVVYAILAYVHKDLLGNAPAAALAAAVLVAQPPSARGEAGAGPVNGPAWSQVAAALLALGAVSTLVAALVFHVPSIRDSWNYLGPGLAVVQLGDTVTTLAVLLLLAVLVLRQSLMGWAGLVWLGGAYVLALPFLDQFLGRGMGGYTDMPTLACLCAAGAAAAAPGASGAHLPPNRVPARWLEAVRGIALTMAVLTGLGAVFMIIGLIAIATRGGQPAGGAVYLLVVFLVVALGGVAIWHTLAKDPPRGRLIALAWSALTLLLWIIAVAVAPDQTKSTVTWLGFLAPVAVALALLVPPSVRAALGPIQLATPGAGAPVGAQPGPYDDPSAWGPQQPGYPPAGASYGDLTGAGSPVAAAPPAPQPPAAHVTAPWPPVAETAPTTESFLPSAETPAPAERPAPAESSTEPSAPESSSPPAESFAMPADGAGPHAAVPEEPAAAPAEDEDDIAMTRMLPSSDLPTYESESAGSDPATPAEGEPPARSWW